MIYDYIVTKPPLNEETMEEYGLTYIEHGRLSGWVKANHKYIDRVLKNGKWVYKYAKSTGLGRVRAAGSNILNTAKKNAKYLGVRTRNTAKKSLFSMKNTAKKSSSAGMNRINKFMSDLRLKYKTGGHRSAVQNVINTAKKNAKYTQTKVKNKANKMIGNAKSSINNYGVSAKNAKNTATKNAKYAKTKVKNIASNAVSSTKTSTSKYRAGAQNTYNTVAKNAKYAQTVAKNQTSRLVEEAKKKKNQYSNNRQNKKKQKEYYNRYARR